MKNRHTLTISTILLIGLWILQTISVSEIATSYFTVIQRLSDKTFILGVLWNLTVKVEIDCAMVCSASLECLAFIHSKCDQRCLGYRYRMNSSLDYGHYPGALYFDKEINCGYPPRKEFANVDLSLKTARYYCDSQKNFPLLTRGDPLSYCLPNGEWSINNFTCKVVECCKDVFSCNPAATDGHFIIYPELTNRHPVQVFCHNINTNPAEYITLYKLNMSVINASLLTGVCTWKERSGDRTTIFRKIRINVTSMLVVRDDFTFADVTKESDPGFGKHWTQPAFGFGMDCSTGSTACSKLGYFVINLKGTGLRLDPNLQWRSFGYQSSIDWFNNGSFAEGRCGGYCGTCNPVGPMQLYIDTSHSFDTGSTVTEVNCNP